MTLAPISTEILQCLTTQQAWHYSILPYKRENGCLSLYVAADQDAAGLEEELEVLLGQAIELTPHEPEALRKAIAQHYRKNANQGPRVKGLDLDANQSKDLLLKLVQEAQQLGSSDIHMEPYENNARIRMRVDGVLLERYLLSKLEYPSLVNKIKIQANLDIAEKRLPQDGRILFKLNDKDRFDIRVSMLPTLHGEKVVLRLLSNSNSYIELSQLGFGSRDLEDYLDGIQKPNGMVLISGPTGSGKTTTLYATLQLLNKTTRNVVTIEDPIEYTLEGINQVQLRENIGFDFPSALRTFLRQDPDIIMVGEIRDRPTASMAIRASLTGHLVLSTIHTNSAWGIIPRLADMEIPTFLLADTLNTAVAQRLVRLLCPHCSKPAKLDPKLFPRRYTPPRPVVQHHRPVGCEQCYFTGYRGRKAVYEVITIDSELATEIKSGNFAVSHLLQERGIKSLADNAFELLEAGRTSIEEVYPILATSS
ncbi:MAG: GspE/PulE family protein [Bacteroidota bacterium]